MTDCTNGEMRDLLPDLLHGRLEAAERAEVESHLRSCEDCREELELLRNMRSALRRAPAVDVDSVVAGITPYRAPLERVPSRSWSSESGLFLRDSRSRELSLPAEASASNSIRV